MPYVHVYDLAIADTLTALLGVARESCSFFQNGGEKQHGVCSAVSVSV